MVVVLVEFERVALSTSGVTRLHYRPAADIPQAEYLDVAAVILGVEPEYAFDIPSDEWLRQWFVISLLGILGVSLLASLAAWLLTGLRLPSSALPWLFWTIAFVLGAAGTTVISAWKGDFVFTWPVSLFIAFQAAVFEIRLDARRLDRSSSRWRARFVGTAFVACCVGYFLLCRRLSLVFEWVFLCGFAAALPFSLAGSHCFRKRRWHFAWLCFMTFVAFASFYWSAAAVLWLKS